MLLIYLPMLVVHVVLLISLSGAIRMACLLAPSALGYTKQYRLL